MMALVSLMAKLLTKFNKWILTENKKTRSTIRLVKGFKSKGRSSKSNLPNIIATVFSADSRPLVKGTFSVAPVIIDQ